MPMPRLRIWIWIALALTLGIAAPAIAAPRALAVTVLGGPEDSRIAAVEGEAVEFWNSRLEEIGANVRFGPVRVVEDSISDGLLEG